MGAVFSSLGTVFSWVGMVFETLCLAIGEIASVLVRGIFTIVVGLCDVLAAVSCCCRRPWSDRPSRGQYDGQYQTMLNVGGEQVLKNLAKQPVTDSKPATEKADSTEVASTPSIDSALPATTPGQDSSQNEKIESAQPVKQQRSLFAALKRSKAPKQADSVAA
ncbi:hypothetical protein V8E36_005559 [Tilletia maclaganii]